MILIKLEQKTDILSKHGIYTVLWENVIWQMSSQRHPSIHRLKAFQFQRFFCSEHFSEPFNSHDYPGYCK